MCGNFITVLVWCVECEDYEVDYKGVAADGNYVFVFNIGKWAEIVEEVKTEETYNVNINSDNGEIKVFINGSKWIKE